MMPLIGVVGLLCLPAIFAVTFVLSAQRNDEFVNTGQTALVDEVARKIRQKIAVMMDALWGDAQCRRVDLEQIRENDLNVAVSKRNRKRGRVPKRLMDIVLSLCLIGLFAPLLIIVAIMIKLDSPGAIFYRQRRVGRYGQVFEVIKFRSMVNDAEKDGARWASQNDSRITKLGQLLRRTRIDEIPQAFNVLRGDMSFVGPRPERPEFVEMLNEEIPHYQDRHKIKPGITGWAQVEYQYGASVEDAREKLKYDLYYIKNFSFALDLIILLKTIRVTLLGIGSR